MAMSHWQTTRETSDLITVATHFSRVALRARDRGDSTAAAVATNSLPNIHRALTAIADERREADATGHTTTMLDRQEEDLYRLEHDLLSLLDQP